MAASTFDSRLPQPPASRISGVALLVVAFVAVVLAGLAAFLWYRSDAEDALSAVRAEQARVEAALTAANRNLDELTARLASLVTARDAAEKRAAGFADAAERAAGEITRLADALAVARHNVMLANARSMETQQKLRAAESRVVDLAGRR